MPFPPTPLLTVICVSFPLSVGVVDPEWVQQRLGKIRILDATLILDPTRSAAKEFAEVRLVSDHFMH